MRVGAGLALLLVTACAGGAAAQQTEVRLALGAGSATDVRGIRSGAYTVAPSLSVLPDPRFAFLLGGSATAFDNGGWSVGGQAGLAARVPLVATLSATLGGAASLTGTSYRSRFASIEATPGLELGLSPVTLFGAVRAARASTTYRGAAEDPFGPLPPAPAPTFEVSRGSLGPVFGGAVRVTHGGTGSLVLAYREEHARLDTLTVRDRQVSATLARHPATLSGTLAFRRAPDERSVFGGVQLGLALTHVLSLDLGAGSYPSNRLTGTLGGRYLSAGLTFRWGGGRQQPPRPSGIVAPAPGMVRLALRAPEARTVEAAGDWNAWRLVPARRAANGVWYVDLVIPPGEYRYAFRVDGKEWRVPEGAAAQDDGFGGKSAWLVVGPDGTIR